VTSPSSPPKKDPYQIRKERRPPELLQQQSPASTPPLCGDSTPSCGAGCFSTAGVELVCVVDDDGPSTREQNRLSCMNIFDQSPSDPAQRKTDPWGLGASGNPVSKSFPQHFQVSLPLYTASGILVTAIHISSDSDMSSLSITRRRTTSIRAIQPTVRIRTASTVEASSTDTGVGAVAEIVCHASVVSLAACDW
jgi:hypothetical protein